MGRSKDGKEERKRSIKLAAECFYNSGTWVASRIREAYDGVLFTNGAYDKQTAANAIRNRAAEAIVFGQKFLANPDLPERLRIDASLNEPDVQTYYAASPCDCIDYPALPSA